MTARAQRLLLHGFWVGDEWTARGVLAATLVWPIVYSLLAPFVLIDLWVQLYQGICFRLLDIALVRRRDYHILDRHRLDYLNPLQKVNCVYCGYVNGVIAFTREVAARTEQFWCPIQHAQPARGQHRRRGRFAPYGDAAAYRRLLPQLREELGTRRAPIEKKLAHSRKRSHRSR